MVTTSGPPWYDTRTGKVLDPEKMRIAAMGIRPINTHMSAVLKWIVLPERPDLSYIVRELARK
eukprot:6667340-Heterocapsa_arctica.AAC.1